ncbi:hypothetical protein LG296_20785 (plasmid) [Ureibacillus chungkukjangi]|uniref:hypothetical protein n=2 Tax=Ureibacillus chungkukjangi TaxID=1202712 RepID=UPI000D3C6E21|nr:hypothetical protein [Ureibacillus chungkukjangi]MCM3389991.1 hypothetical protein [Ureibacillus chungkukjangi]
MIFDMTDYKNTIKSLAEFLDLMEDEISDFVLNNKDADVMDFLKAFSIEDDKLLEKNIELVSLHSTSSIDDCKSLKEKGLINLQEAVLQETPLKAYLEKKCIQINLEEKYILFKGKKFDISEKIKGYSLSDEEDHKNTVIHKFYGDFQVNGFLYHENVVTYGGNTRDRPEILLDLARFLNDRTIEDDWTNHKNKQHYILKFKQPLNFYTWFTFPGDYEDSDYGVTEDNLEYLDSEVIEAKVKKWVINRSMDVIRGNAYEAFSYVHPDWKIEPKDILEFMKEDEYLTKYKIYCDY